MICFILGCFLGIGSVSAKEEVFYGPYSDYSPWQQKSITASDTVAVQKERRYRFYYEEKKYGDYVLWKENSKEYPFLDMLDTKKGKWSAWQEKKPDKNENQEIEKKRLYQYQKVKQVRYVYIYGMKGSDGSLSIPEIKIYHKENPIAYTVLCEECTNGFVERLQDGNIYDIENKILNDRLFILDLEGYYNIEDIVLGFYFYDPNPGKKYITYSFMDQMVEHPNYLTENQISMGFQSKNETDIFNYDTFKYEYLIYSHAWDEVKYSKDEVLSDPMTKVKYGDFYRYRDIYYHSYQKNRYETEDYFKTAPELYHQKIEDDYQDWYRFKIRDKVTLSGNYIITQNSFQPNDLILNQTKDVQIEGNVDTTQNGVYSVIFDFGFQKIKRQIIVDILENTIREYRVLQKKEKEIKKEIQRIADEGMSQNEDHEKKIDLLKQEQRRIWKQKKELEEKIVPKVESNFKFPYQISYFVVFFLLLILLGYLGRRYYIYEKS